MEVIDAPRRVRQRGIAAKTVLNMWDGHMPQQAGSVSF